MRHPAILFGSVVLVFFLTLGIMWQVMPQPRKDIDYLVMGGSATMVSMVVLFVVLINTTFKGQDIFFKRKK